MRVFRHGVAAVALIAVFLPAGTSAAAAGSRLSVKAPAVATAGKGFSVTVTVLDQRGRRNTAYRGTVKLTTSDAKGVFPHRYTFRKIDSGRHVFRGIVLTTAATQHVRVADTTHSSLRGQASVSISPAALDHLSVSPANVSAAPAAPIGSNSDFVAKAPTERSFSATGRDKYGNSLGDVTADTTFSIGPDGECTPTGCDGATPGPHTVTATDGTATGEATLVVDSYATAYDMTCQGEHYDVDGDLVNGCEQTQPHAGATTQGAAYDDGSLPCTDGSSNPALSGSILSDSRTHANPSVTGFVAAAGSAPVWSKVTATGGNFCSNDLSLTLTTSGGGSTACYRLTVVTSVNTYPSATINGHDSATISPGAGSYTDNSTIYFKVEKTCSLPTQESVGYTVTGHL